MYVVYIVFMRSMICPTYCSIVLYYFTSFEFFFQLVPIHLPKYIFYQCFYQCRSYVTDSIYLNISLEYSLRSVLHTNFYYLFLTWSHSGFMCPIASFFLYDFYVRPLSRFLSFFLSSFLLFLLFVTIPCFFYILPSTWHTLSISFSNFFFFHSR